jgi:hypothetical protein
LPVVLGARYSPVVDTAPPLVAQITVGVVVLPSDQVPFTANWYLTPGAMVTLSGMMVREVRLAAAIDIWLLGVTASGERRSP